MRDFIRVGAFSPILSIGDPLENAHRIIDEIENNEELKQCDIIVTPEMSLVGYTSQDMFNSSFVQEKVVVALQFIKNNIEQHKVIIVGAPIKAGNSTYNCAVTIIRDKIVHITPKKYIPNYGEFYEKRWFESGFNLNNDKPDDFMSIKMDSSVLNIDGCLLASEVCEDLWAPIPPSAELALSGARIITNCSASNETVGKADFRRDLVRMQSAKCICAYVYCSSGISESTSDLVFGGHNIIAENGVILAESELFDMNNLGIVTADINVAKLNHDRSMNKTFCDSSSKINDTVYIGPYFEFNNKMEYDKLNVDITPFVPSEDKLETRCSEIFDMQVAGLASRLMRTHSKKVVVGVSGGLDSTLALLVACGAMDKLDRPRSDVLGITMPCFGTTKRTKDNANALMKSLGCDSIEINITNSVEQHLIDIGLSKDDRSVAYENAQARERTQVLMDMANKVGGFVIGTGDLSELALGWCTYNGDHMSMYSVNSSIPKTLVRSIIDTLGHKQFVCSKEIIEDILNTPVSPELLPPNEDGTIQQLTEDSVGPYVLNDFFIHCTVRCGYTPRQTYELAKIACKKSDKYNYSNDEIKKWLGKFYERFFKAQFKRNCMPDGVKVGSVSFSPRGDWRCPSEFDYSAFVDEVNKL